MTWDLFTFRLKDYIAGSQQQLLMRLMCLNQSMRLINLFLGIQVHQHLIYLI